MSKNENIFVSTRDLGIFEAFFIFLWCRVVDPDPDTDLDPAFQVNPDPDTDPDTIRIHGFDDQKLKKKIQLKFFLLSFFDQKMPFPLSFGLHKERPRYMRSPQSSKENIKHFKK
jgi:hypothetical protein